MKIHELSGSFKDCNVNQKKKFMLHTSESDKGRALDGAWSAVREKKRAPTDQLIGARRLVLFTNTGRVFFLHKEYKRKMTISLFLPLKFSSTECTCTDSSRDDPSQ